MIRILILILLRTYFVALNIAACRGRGALDPPRSRKQILLTGTFHSTNWIGAHIGPLASSTWCSGITVVTVNDIPEMPKVRVIRPPRWAVRIFGSVPARMIWFMGVGLRESPDYVGGFHLLFNGLAAGLLAKMIRTRSIYFCVGGPAEVEGGGILSENRLFEKLTRKDPLIEKLLLNALDNINLIVTMGRGAASFLREHGVRSEIHIVPGGLDENRYSPSDEPASYDIIFVGRLAPIKRIDILLRTIFEVRKKLPKVRVVVVGDGPLRNQLEALASQLSLGDSVTFSGIQANVEHYLRNAKIFVLTSQSEGLSLSLMEAMLCGLPAVVANVGDLSDLVRSGENGYLIDGDDPAVYGQAIIDILRSPDRYRTFSNAARASGERFSFKNTVKTWDKILSDEGHASVIDRRPLGQGAS